MAKRFFGETLAKRHGGVRSSESYRNWAVRPKSVYQPCTDGGKKRVLRRQRHEGVRQLVEMRQLRWCRKPRMISELACGRVVYAEDGNSYI